MVFAAAGTAAPGGSWQIKKRNTEDANHEERNRQLGTSVNSDRVPETQSMDPMQSHLKQPLATLRSETGDGEQGELDTATDARRFSPPAGGAEQRHSHRVGNGRVYRDDCHSSIDGYIHVLWDC